MAIERGIRVSRVALRLLAAAGAAALIAGCSDASRFSADPFSNPFGSSAKGVDRAPTGAITAAPSPSATPGRVESRPLAAPTSAASKPAAAAPAPTASGGGSHWSAEGGTPIVVAQGETAAMIANRYGVPADALLRANGLSAASQVQPGARLVVPVYRASATPAAKPAPSTPVATASPAKAAPAKIATQAETKAAANKSVKSDAAKQGRKGADAKGAEKAKVAAKPDATPAKPERLAKAAPAKEEAAAPAPVERRVAKAAERRESVKVAATEKPAESAPAAARPLDKTATASIPPAQEEKSAAVDAAHPEFRWPARGRIIQGFTAGGNDGINIAVPEGTQVKAAEGGVVAYAGSELKGYGNLVLIRHPNGFVSAYAHNGALEVKRGDQVKRGQTIAKSGQSGNVGSPQLHFELRKGSTPVDPTSYLAGL